MSFSLLVFHLDRTAKQPLYRQLYQAIRQAILERRLRPGQRLPASRALAEQLGLSRSTVLLAFDHLLTEGYVEGRTGAGTFVSERIPDELLRTAAAAGDEAAASGPVRLSRQANAILELPFRQRLDTDNLWPFRPGVPALRDFPYDLWSRLLSRESRRLTMNDYGYSAPAGYPPLRTAIAEYLRLTRAVRCEAAQVIITSGSQQALDLCCRLLLDPGDGAWVEDPGYNGVKEALTAAGAAVIPVPVDGEGLLVGRGASLGPDVRLVYITPSHQYPLGVTMSLQRRLQLLEWAAGRPAWIIEDDYDSEYRYDGRPLSSLQGIDRDGRVLYMGTFSKVLFPGLRLGYLVVPPALVDAFTAAKAFSDRHNPVLEQAVLARFLVEGHFERHLRRMRLLYEERQAALVAAVRDLLPGRLEIRPADTGLHLVGWLPAGSDDSATAAGLRRHGISVNALSGYTVECRTGPGLVMGYAPYRPQEIRRAVEKMARDGTL